MSEHLKSHLKEDWPFKRDLCGKHNKKQTTWDCSFVGKKSSCKKLIRRRFSMLLQNLDVTKTHPCHGHGRKNKNHPFRNLNPERRRGPAQTAQPGEEVDRRLTSLNKKNCLTLNAW